MSSPGLAVWLAKNAASYDILHIHAGRDFISTLSMGITRLMGRPYVAQTHGMVAPDQRSLVWLMDFLFTRRLLRAASRRFVLTRHEADDLRVILGPSATTERLMNGVPKASQRAQPSEKREVLFCARLHARKRPVSFVQVASELTRRGVGRLFLSLARTRGNFPPSSMQFGSTDLSKSFTTMAP